MTIQQANDVPRWNHVEGLHVLLEHGVPRSVARTLRDMGHKPRPAPAGQFGGSQAVLVDPATGTYLGASDPRKDGAALGY
jgi:gamma-glutamyltranspeptidase/glutathione hydrolase